MTKQMNNKLKIKKIIILLLTNIILFAFASFSQDIAGEEIWMGWAVNEYNNYSYGACANNSDDERLKVDGYGRYQFKYNTNLIDFLKYADEGYFKKWIDFGKGSERLNNYNDGLPQAWTDYYASNTEKFKELQDKFLYEKYFSQIKRIYSNSGISLNDAYVKGAIFSIAMYRVNNNEISQSISVSSLNDLINLYDANNDIYVKKIYDAAIERYTDEKDIKRFSKEKQECLEKRDDAFDSHIGEILNKKGDTNSITFIRELNNLNPSIFREFLQKKKFTDDKVLEWYDAVRTSVNFHDEFNITSGVLDFGTSTSHGIDIDGYLGLIENEVVFKIPSNGSNTYYIPQNTNKASYSELKFGVNNIAQGGSSLACMSMAISKLKGKIVIPSEIYYKLKDKYNDVNYFYDKNKMGNKNEIIEEIANFYGLKSNIISQNSVIGSLINGNVVVARVSDSEFTKYGTFILLCGVRSYNGKNYIIVADPNIYHTRYLYKLYDINYLANTCNGIFFEISM